MIRKHILKKIGIAVSAIVIATLIYLFPKDETTSNVKKNEDDICKSVVYVLDKNNMVSRIKITEDIKDKDVIDSAKLIIDYLTIKNDNTASLPSGFSAIIPKETKILTIDYNNEILKVNFSKEFLSISEEIEVKLIEAIVFSLTELDSVSGVMIFVESELLTELPHSKKILDTVLTRRIGVNKIYDLYSMKETRKVIVYYLAENNAQSYYVPVTKIINGSKEKIEIIVEELQSSSIRQTNLKSYLTMNTELLEYEILEDAISLSFNKNILNGFNNNILEEVTYTLSLSVKDNYDIDNIIFKVNDDFILTKNIKNG